MGFIKTAKADLAAGAAKRALEEGRSLFIYFVDVPKAAVQGQALSGVAEQLESIEAMGWRIESINALRDSMVAVFRR